MWNNFFDKDFVLIVSLPMNNFQLAKTAMEAGADALKIHLNVEHFASGTKFGIFSQEKEIIEKILSLKIPVGLMPGTDKSCATEDEIKYLIKKGLCFIDIYEEHAKPYILTLKNVLKMIAIGENFNISRIKYLADIGTNIIEASIFPHNLYGSYLTVKDIALLAEIVNNTSLPVIVPTQKLIKPDDIKFLRDIGVKGLMIGAIVTGKKQNELFKAVKRYKDEIDKIL